jgi:hypothetical protein
MASRQAPASTKAREIEVLSKRSLPDLEQLARELTGWTAAESTARRAILLHQKILRKLTEAKLFVWGVEVVCHQRGGTDRRELGRR